MFLFLFSLFQLHYRIQKWSQQEIAKAVVSAWYEQTYDQTSVKNRLLGEFPKLEKLNVSQFESEDAVGLRITQEFLKLKKLI